METSELMQAWQTLQNHCNDLKKSGRGRDCALYNVCKTRECSGRREAEERLKKAMYRKIPVELDGCRYDYICGYATRRTKYRDEIYTEVELMDVNGNSVVRAPIDRVKILGGA